VETKTGKTKCRTVLFALYALLLVAMAVAGTAYCYKLKGESETRIVAGYEPDTREGKGAVGAVGDVRPGEEGNTLDIEEGNEVPLAEPQEK
jgi:hypothetical protein